MVRYRLNSYINAICTILREGIIYIYLVFEVLHSKISIGDFSMYVALFFNFSNILSEITVNLADIKGENLIINNFRKFIEYDEDTESSNTCRWNQKGEACEIRLENVFFHYVDTERDIIRDLNLVIHPGEKIAVVGENGAGKSTLVKLICNLYEPASGEIYVEGKNIKDFSKKEYFKKISVVFQDANILEFSFAENIAMCSRKFIDEKRLNEAIEKSDLEGKLNKLSKKENTFIGKNIEEDGVLLSGGESQKLMLARAYYKDSRIVILDEPTAALDPIAEKNIYEKYDELVENRTAIFISHRLASTKFCDRIIVLGEGKIVEEGTHEQLMEKNGKYAQMFRIQAQYYV